MAKRPQCPRCGREIDAGLPFCPYCGSPSDRKRDEEEQNAPERADKNASSQRKKANKAIYVLLAVLCAGFVGLGILVLDDRRQEPAAPAAASPSGDAADMQELLATIAPSPTPAKPTPVPASEKVLGTWTATRVETNTKKSKDLDVNVSAALGDYRTRIMFLSDNTASILVDQQEGAGLQAEERPWYSSGEDIFIDKGDEAVDGVTMIGRNRFFFKDDLLYCVYTLDGKDASDYIVYSRSNPSGEASGGGS